ncbi:unnamed protein product [uncultured bacterium]|nr:unnamed protein product [uncultured bacterium]
MEGSFACPECGSEVEVRGLAPGRQVRCGFCHRLLEVPFLPRAGDAPWKRRRFARPWWIAWAWRALALIALIVAVAGSWQFLKHQYSSYQERSVNRLLESSRKHEAHGRWGDALVDLDAALQLAGQAGPVILDRLDREQEKRPDLARRDARAILDRLTHDQASLFPLGDWLTLKARAARDPDLESLVRPIQAQFEKAARERVDLDVSGARHAAEVGDMSAALAGCNQIARLLGHLPMHIRPAARDEAEALVKRIVATHGITVDMPKGIFIHGSGTYVSEMLPVLRKTLQAKGYLPNDELSPWSELWSHALYRIRLEVLETQEGNYLSSENRLTRIEAALSLTSNGEIIWQTKPTARSEVPLPKLPAYLASRVATNRSDEFEDLLYQSAREQIDGRFRLALANMPACPSSTTAGTR